MAQRMSNQVTGALSGDSPLDEQYAIISEVVAKALRELRDTAGPDQQITSISVELADSIQVHGGDNMLTVRFTAEVDTRLR